jgi:hypothetical protein
MPLYWNLDSQERLLTAEAIGDVTRGEADALLDALEAAGVEAMTYRKLFDGSRGHAAMAADDLLALEVRIRGFHALGPMGRLAVVTPPDQGDLVARIPGVLAAADRPMRMFRDVARARRWIAMQAKATAPSLGGQLVADLRLDLDRSLHRRPRHHACVVRFHVGEGTRLGPE